MSDARHQDLAAGRARLEALERFDARSHELEARAHQLADDRLAEELLPPAFSLAVVHHQVRVPELAGGAEIEHPVADPPVEDDGGVAQGTEGDRDRHAAYGVVGDLVPHQDLQRIGPRVAVDDHADHRLGGREVIDLGDRLEGRVVDRRNAVLGRAARHDLAEVDRGAGEIRLRPLPFPGRRIGPRYGGVCENPKPDENNGRTPNHVRLQNL